MRYDLVNRIGNTVKDFQHALKEKIDLTLEGIRLSFQRAIALHQSGKTDVERNLGELSQRLGSISTIQEQLLGYAPSLNHDASDGRNQGSDAGIGFSR
ncbi:MAG: hypothetical protein HGA84_02450 [Syntrophobacteraceae bacterium]|nr:hypothetical protein [Syntrophobacteraceae bacterium]